MKLDRRRAQLMSAFVVLASLGLVALFAELIVSNGPLVAFDGERLVLPWSSSAPTTAETGLGRGWAVWPLITDRGGVYHWVHGARRTAVTMVLGVSLAAVGGVLFGALSKIGPRWLDALAERVVEAAGAMPGLVMLAIVAASPRIPNAAGYLAVVVLLRATDLAKIVRGRLAQLMAQDFVVASTAMGSTRWRVVHRHLLPHLAGPILVSATGTSAAVVGWEAALAFVGLDVTEGGPSWGAAIGRHTRNADPMGAIGPTVGVILALFCVYTLASAADRRFRTGNAHL